MLPVKDIIKFDFDEGIEAKYAEYRISKFGKPKIYRSALSYGHDVDRLDKLEPLALLT